ncbi:hypothetical protein [Pseudomonas aeruginosa]|uniref:hypothetical protein n=1 Tax=Pseudomonas aeruginosa TaxID=287 RepID=UPI001C9DD94D|nr:hypothetical protein [Pseudomonas aeruginosa]MBY9433018.1 hypothetical protein [Pseudomonas aeruginosa]QZV83757.1 hypothetical protein KUU71_32910 [Pseudomonas aeruginosa]
MGSCAAPSAKGDDKFITTDYLQQCRGLDYDEGHCIPFVFDGQAESVSALELLKLADTYHRNSCDAPGYYKSRAYELLSRIREAAIEDLPGFKEAPGWV